MFSQFCGGICFFNLFFAVCVFSCSPCFWYEVGTDRIIRLARGAVPTTNIQLPILSPLAALCFLLPAHRQVIAGATISSGIYLVLGSTSARVLVVARQATPRRATCNQIINLCCVVGGNVGILALVLLRAASSLRDSQPQDSLAPRMVRCRPYPMVSPLFCDRLFCTSYD